MGDFWGGEPGYKDPEICPECGRLMAGTSTICASCSGKRSAKLQEERNKAERSQYRADRIARFECALEIGWTIEELWPKRKVNPRKADTDDPLPTWEQLLEKGPEIVIQRWWRSVQ